jgi:hypothetical protein
LPSSTARAHRALLLSPADGAGAQLLRHVRRHAVATINGGTLPIRFRIETAPAPLSADLIDPSSTSSGLFGGEVLALQFNVDFSDAGLISGSAGLAFGDTNVADALDYAHR